MFLSLTMLLAATPSAEALAVLARHQCNRCHVVEGLREALPPASCAGCHVDLAGTVDNEARTREGRERYGDAWDRFVTRTALHYQHVPPLVGMERLDAAWLARFLETPFTVRPHISERMFRPNLTADERAILVRGWGARAVKPPGAAKPTQAAIDAGRAIFIARGCPACHVFGATTFPPPTLEVARAAHARAPDLRHTRERLDRAMAMAFIKNPAGVMKAAVMPTLGITDAEARLLTDFLYFAEPGVKPRATRTLPAYDASAAVPSWEEVSKVFKATCWHCHSNADFADGDGGPGNTGGFGFKGVGLSFASFAEVMSGSLAPTGNRRSVFRKGESGEPVLLERLRARVVEEAELESSALRGMPLGLPALSDADFSLIERWVKGGRPGPRSP